MSDSQSDSQSTENKILWVSLEQLQLIDEDHKDEECEAGLDLVDLSASGK